MADLGIYTKNADIQALAGVNANATSKATAATDLYVLNVENKINSLTRKKWSTAWATISSSEGAGILTETGAALCAMKVIQSDMSGFTSRYEAETMLDYLRDVTLTNMAILRNKNTETFINGA
ncbi:MAG TPA: hypothetical protein ENI23_01910 [bacterium]|nr:hypothetical protein [bacterium]